MTDRFKFRCYNKFQEKMFEVRSMSYYDGIIKRIEVQDEERILIFDEWENNINNTILMQCTGLKDKNDKLIYEGDIINDKLNHIRVVVWEQDSFKYPALKTSRYFHSPIPNKLEERKVDLRRKLTFQDNVRKCDKKYFEVIGNIYENKELLNENS